ncbi:MAG: PorT family protein [Prevotellaceae bacterium]|nr:PorT family protein [Prevotellaceae bacterium]
MLTYESPVEPSDWETICQRLNKTDEAREQATLQSRLVDYEQPVTAADWDIINRRLSQSKRRRAVAIWFTAGSAVAAAVALFFVLPPLVTKQERPVKPPVAGAIHSPAATTGQEPAPARTSGSGKTSSVQPSTVYSQTIYRTKVTVTPPAIPSDTKAPTILTESNVQATDSTQSLTPHPAEQIAENTTGGQSNAQSNAVQHDSLSAFPLTGADETLPAKTTKKQWSIALLSGQSGGMDFSNTTNSISIAQPPPGRPGAPPSRQLTDTRHHLPLSFGITVRFNLLTSRWALESGVVYTYLSSEYTYSRDPSTIKKQLHYLGIPINVVYRIVDSRRFSFYAAGGGMIEKGLAANSTTIADAGTHIDKESIHGLQWSLNGQLGAEYRFYKQFSIYIEPGVRYFIPYENQPQSIRTDRPFTFLLGCGLRTSF